MSTSATTDATTESPQTVGTRIARDFEGAAGVGLVYLGDRLGLFTALLEGGPATGAEPSARTGLVERYVREWLAGVAAAEYVHYDPATERFSLTEEQTAYFADAHSALFSAPTAQFQLKILAQADAVAEAFRHGGGVPYSAFDPDVTWGFERSSRACYRNNLVTVWLPALPGVTEALQAGGSLLDVGCGGGGARLEAACAFPGAQVVGIDTHPPAVEQARAAAQARPHDRRSSPVQAWDQAWYRDHCRPSRRRHEPGHRSEHLPAGRHSQAARDREGEAPWPLSISRSTRA